MRRFSVSIAKPDKYDSCLRHELNVQWGDQDAFSHVNNVMYLRYFESARIAYMGASGWLEGSVLPIIKNIKCDYLKQVTFPATIQMYTCVIDLRSKGLTIATLFEVDGIPVAQASAVTLTYDFKARKVVEMPPTVVEWIHKVDAHQLPHVKERLKTMLD